NTVNDGEEASALQNQPAGPGMTATAGDKKESSARQDQTEPDTSVATHGKAEADNHVRDQSGQENQTADDGPTKGAPPDSGPKDTQSIVSWKGTKKTFDD